jgi:hypothetical protein
METGEGCELDGVSQALLSEETATSWRRLSFYAPLARIAVWPSKPYLADILHRYEGLGCSP